MGGKYRIEDNMLFLEGGHPVHGAITRATDLRCGAALLVAGLGAEGKTLITNSQQLYRGYEHLAEKLSGLGATVQVVKAPEEHPHAA
jgi:UDP-N-acetylglucosamine 1-carboxyvinyltransferase